MLVLTLLGAIWGASFIFMRIAAPVVGALSLAEWRIASAALVLLPFGIKRFKTLKQKDLHHLLVIGVINSALPFTLLAYASLHLSAGFASIMNATAPLFSALWGTLLFGEKLNSKQQSGLALGFIGAWVLLSDKISIQNGFNADTLPILAGFAAAACYGFAANYSKKHLANVHPQSAAFWNCTFASLALLPLTYQGPYIWNFEPKVLYATLFLGILSTAVAYLLYFKLLIQAGATRAISVTFLIPIFACFWGWIFLDEVVTFKMILGAAIVFWGIRRMMKK